PGASSSLARPTVSGIAGTAAGDAATVGVVLYAGFTATGTAQATLSAPVDPTGAFSATAAEDLAPGIYTAQVAQADDLGHTGISAPVTFVITAPPAAPGPPAAPPAAPPATTLTPVAVAI